MQWIEWRKLGWVLLVSLPLASCGGGSDGSGASSNSTTATSGVITGFGSVFINGVEYETTNTSISTDDNAGATESELEVGMVVTIDGTVNDDGVTGEATSIHYEEQLKGPLVGTVDIANRTFTVLGQTIIYDDLTSIGSLDLSALVNGDFLEISGFTRADNTLYATRIEKETGSVSTYKVQGNIRSLNNGAQTFVLGGLIINYSSASFVQTSASALVNGMAVRVKGDAANFNSGTSTFTVNQVKSKEESYEDGERGSLEGYITAFTSVSDFEVNGVAVTTTSSTRYDDGSAAGLALNVRVKVFGSFNSDGELVASKIKLHNASKVGLEANVTAIDIGASTVSVLGVEFVITNQTKMEDDSSDNERFFDINDVSVGDFVKVKGFESSSGDYVAALFERKNDDNDNPEIKGKVTAVSGSSISLLGLNLTVDGSTTYSGGISAIGDISVGDTLEIEATDALLAVSVELDD